MKAIFQNCRTGMVEVVGAPAPASRRECVTVSVQASLVSVGTERAMMEVAGESLLGKALARPGCVKQVVGKVRSDGLLETYRQARPRLDLPVPLSHSAGGVVAEVGGGVTGISVGDRVTCAGYPCAAYAEVLCVPRKLCVPLPGAAAAESKN